MVKQKLWSDERDSFLTIRAGRNYNYEKTTKRELEKQYGFTEKVFRWVSYKKVHGIILIYISIFIK